MFESDLQMRAGGTSLGQSAIASLTVSLILHGTGVIILSSSLLRIPALRQTELTQHYAVRHIDLHVPELRPRKPEPAAHQQNASNSTRRAPSSSLPEGGGHDQQTLVQPEFRTHEPVPLKAALPAVVVWAPELATEKNIVLPSTAPPTVVQAPPSLESPNHELQVVSNPVTSGKLTPLVDMQPPGTTSPIQMQAQTTPAVQAPPTSTTRTSDPPTPAAVLSVSDLRMRDGSVVLPPVNQLHGPNAAAVPGGAESDAKASPLPSPAATPPAKAGEPDRDALAASLNSAHLKFPKDGRFGFVAVGGMDGDQYPEVFEMWSGRIAYTAYLHVGLAKSWIMQYAQTRAADAESAGVVARLEAPWPYDILRPNLSPRDMTSDALIVHGTLSESGRFESLAIAFPAKLAAADTILRALKEWQFRPARQQGKAVSVEVLLIIPDQAG